MIIEPDFFEHWKTKALVELTKRPESPLWVMRLWAHCQQRKAWKFHDLPAIAIKAICGVSADLTPEAWLQVLVDCRFVVRDGEAIEIHDWKKHNAGLVANWKNGQRPKRKRARSDDEATAKPRDSQSKIGPSDRLDRYDRLEGKDRKDRKSKPGALVVAEVSDEPLKNRLLEVNALMARRASTPWSAKEWSAFQAMGLDRLEGEAWAAQIGPLAAYYAAPRDTWLREFWGAKPGDDFRRRDLLTLLHNWPGEVDRAVKFGDWLEQKKRRDEEGALP